MIKGPEGENSQPEISRRSALVAAGVCFAMLGERVLGAMGDDVGSAGADSHVAGQKATFTTDSEANGTVEIAGIHDGKGKVRIKYFAFDGAPAPAHFMIYELPPGASEGVHTHFLDDRNKQGSYDEYYYVISGQGQMEIDGKIIPIAKGDNVHTPLEVAHGVENTHPTEKLRVFLTFIKRGNEPSPERAMRKP